MSDPIVRINLITTAISVLTFILVSFAFVTIPLGRCDPYAPPLTGVEVEGAHIVSEGAYFRFWIFNNNSFAIYVQMRGQSDRMIVPPNGSVNYNVVAPRISGIFEQVTYEFALTGPSNASLVNFPVIVVNSFLVQIFNLLIPILLIIIGTVVVSFAIVTMRRRRKLKKT
jgi:hypothetical protein